MQISKKSQYGLRAMVYLSNLPKKNNIASLKQVSQKEGIPFDFLEKILSELEKAKLVKSKKGVKGGYFLAKKPDKISASDIVMILENKKTPVNCRFCGRARRCLTKNVWKKIEDVLYQTLDSIKLSDLTNK